MESNFLDGGSTYQVEANFNVGFDEWTRTKGQYYLNTSPTYITAAPSSGIFLLLPDISNHIAVAPQSNNI